MLGDSSHLEIVFLEYAERAMFCSGEARLFGTSSSVSGYDGLARVGPEGQNGYVLPGMPRLVLEKTVSFRNWTLGFVTR